MTARGPVSSILIALGLVCGFVDAAQAQTPSDPAADETHIPEPTIRAAARRILSDSAFSGFDHFDANPRAPQGSVTPQTTPSLEERPAASDAETKSAGDSSTNRSRNWWDDVRNTPRKSSSSEETPQEQSTPSSDAEGTATDNSGQSGRRREPSTSPQTGPTPQTGPAPQTGQGSQPSGESSSGRGTSTRSDSDAGSDGSPNAERPQRAEAGGNATPSRPAQLGSDGVERPVRFAPKPPPAPRSSSDPNWNFDFGLGWLLSGIGSVLGGLFHGVAYLALALVVLLLAGLAARAIVELLARRRNHAHVPGMNGTLLADERSPGELAADVYLQRALEFARGGDYRSAVAQLLLGAMSAIERRQWIRYRRGLTLADYLRSVRTQPATYSGLTTVVRVYEPIEYGRQPATEAQFQTALNGYQQGFAALP